MWFFLSKLLCLQSVLMYYTCIINTLDNLHVTLAFLLNSIAIAFFLLNYWICFPFFLSDWNVKENVCTFFLYPKTPNWHPQMRIRSLQHNDGFHQTLFRLQRGKIILLCLPRHDLHGFLGIFFAKIDISANTIQTFQTVEFWGGKNSRPCYIYIN